MHHFNFAIFQQLIEDFLIFGYIKSKFLFLPAFASSLQRRTCIWFGFVRPNKFSSTNIARLIIGTALASLNGVDAVTSRFLSLFASALTGRSTLV